MKLVHPSRKTLIASLKVEKVIVFMEYSDFANVFFPNSIIKLLKYFKINNHFIDLENDKQLSY